MRHVLDKLIGTLEQGEPAILGAIVRSSGSAPRTSGARMLVLKDGTLAGTIGGGVVEGTCQVEAKKLFADSQTHVELNFSLDSTEAADQGMVCGGSLSVLLHKVEPDAVGNLQQLRRLYQKGLRPLLLTLLPNGETPPRLITFGVGEEETLPAEVQNLVLNKGRRLPFTVNLEGQEIFVEPLVHPGTVYLLGAGHVALATAHLASYAGFEVVVMDDRVEFANRERYPEARQVHVLDTFENCIPEELGVDDYVVIVTRGHLHDKDVLAQSLRTNAGYIGMIGSKKKRNAVYDALLREGFLESDLQRVYSPIGLNIGGDTPGEIGVSIVAELVKIRADRNR